MKRFLLIPEKVQHLDFTSLFIMLLSLKCDYDEFCVVSEILLQHDGVSRHSEEICNTFYSKLLMHWNEDEIREFANDNIEKYTTVWDCDGDNEPSLYDRYDVNVSAMAVALVNSTSHLFLPMKISDAEELLDSTWLSGLAADILEKQTAREDWEYEDYKERMMEYDEIDGMFQKMLDAR